MRPFLTLAGLIAVWWAVQAGFAVPDYLLPSPPEVARAAWAERGVLAGAAVTTGGETIAGFVLGCVCGACLALGMTQSAALRRWLMPVLLLSQAVPVFAVAPLLVLWLGFGVTSKVAMAALMIFFPVASAFGDGLQRTPASVLDLARTMQARPWRVLVFLRIPAALPALGSGLRVAAAWAPAGAVIGEWVGASSGLGYLMLNANARVRTDLMAAALFVLCGMTVALWWCVDRALRRLLRWDGA